MNRRMITLLATGAAGALAFSVPGFAGDEFRNKYPTTTNDPASTQDCGAGDKVTFDGPLKLWPPNHKMQDVSVTAQEGDGNGPVTLAVTPSATDAAGGDGGPKHDPDYSPTNSEGDIKATDTDGNATVGLQLRSERSGKGDGRTYTLDWEAVFKDNKTCTSKDAGRKPFVVTVPHDMRGGRSW